MHERTYSADTPFSYLSNEPVRVRPQIRNPHFGVIIRNQHWLADMELHEQKEWCLTQVSFDLTTSRATI